VAVLIDRRELLEKARQRNLNLQIIEKDYVLGWLLFGLSMFDSLLFKGGTALSKIYFPHKWRLSEDLDFAFPGQDFETITNNLDKIFTDIKEKSGITFAVKNQFSNPYYLQLKIRYDAILGRNWAKVDVTIENPLDETNRMPLSQTYSDYPDFTVRIESLEEIFAEKLRALVERTKCRDFYDIWRLCSTDFNNNKVIDLFQQKCELKGIKFLGKDQFFKDNLLDILRPYWQRELGRLLNPLPDLNELIAELQVKLDFLQP